MNITITQLNRKERVSKAGKPYTSLGIRCQEYGERWINLFGNKDNSSWKVGDNVEILVVEKDGYLNGSMPTQVKNAPSDAIVARLENFITLKMEPMMTRMEAALDRLETLGAQMAGEENDEFPIPDFGEGR